MSENNSFTYTWKIKNFTFNTCDVNESLESPCFYAVPLLGTGWKLHLFPRGKALYSGHPSYYMACFLHRSDACGPDGIIVKFEIAIVGKDDSILLPWKSQFQVFKKGDPSGWGNLTVWNIHRLRTERDKFFPDNDFTIQCCLSMQYYAALYSCVSDTVIECEKRSFQRKIENVSEFTNPGHRVDIKLPFRDPFDMFVCSNDTEFLSTSIRKVLKDDKKSFFMSGKVSVLDGEGKPIKSIEGEFLFKDSNSEWKFSLIYLKKLQRDEVLVEDTLTLLFELVLSDGQSTPETKASPEALLLKKNDESTVHREQLSEDLNRALISKEYTDFTLRCADEAFPVHRGILAARSPVFRKMLQNDFLEKKNGEVTVEKLDKSTIRNFLTYLYSGKAECQNLDEVADLLGASEEFQILSLKEKCANTIKENITLDNVLAILLMSERFRLRDVKKQALKFILLHHTEVEESENWTRFIRAADVQLEIEVRRLIHSFQKSEIQK